MPAQTATAVNPATLASMLGGYIRCALWSSTDNSDPETGGDPMDQNYSREDLAPRTLDRLERDCAAFLAKFRDMLAEQPGDAEQAGHDLWLTRNGHGTGFWDRGDDVWTAEARKAFNAYANRLAPRDLYVGDDGMIYVM
jgi:hypothetical protein